MSAVAELDRESESESERTGFSSPTPPDAASADGLVTGSSESSGVSAKGGSPRSNVPTEEQLLDVLYEVLVQGVPPRSTLTREQVEQFLHQHARQTKPLGEMLAFFEQHGLPTDPGAYGADRELGELASGLQKERNSLLPGFGPVDAHEPERLAQPLPQTLPPLVQAAAPAAVAPASAPFVAALENEKTGR
ncbi:MAG: hypothetical protein JWN04_1666, partial [Myxococcaceae bacterium]|nr:hypothetical protein [Myxococcaceae bacterium]